MELSTRQIEIVELVRKHAPVTGEQIAEMLGLSRPTIRSDLSLLIMLGLLNAKPKVGYYPGTVSESKELMSQKLHQLKVKDVQSLPVIIRESATVQDAVVALFTENVGSLIVADEEGRLVGVVTRKDLLKVTLGNAGAGQMPVSMAMSRLPGIATVSPEDTVPDAARKLLHHDIDILPVVDRDAKGDRPPEIIGRITRTTMTRVLLDLTKGPGDEKEGGQL